MTSITWISANDWIAWKTQQLAESLGWSYPVPSDRGCGFKPKPYKEDTFTGTITPRSSSTRGKRQYTDAQRAEAIRMIEAGLPWKRAMEATGLRSQTISRFMKARREDSHCGKSALVASGGNGKN